MTERAGHTRNRKLIWAGGAVAVAVVALSAMDGTAIQASPQEYRIAGNHVAVYNLAGAVSVVPATGSDVVVTVHPRGPDAERLDVESGSIRGTQTLRVRYPSDRVIYSDMGGNSRTRVRVRDDGTFGHGGFSRGDRVDIRSSGSGLEAWADLTIAVPPGQRFSLYLGAGATEARDVEGDLELDTQSGSIESAGTTGSLSIDTGSGSVRVSAANGDLDVDTGSGQVTLDGVAGERVLVDTGSGSVHGSDIRSESVEVDTGSGRITLLAVEAPDIMVDTGSGSVEVDMVADVERLEVDTGSGGVTLRVPGDLGALMEVDTGSGTIEVEVPIDESTRRRSFLRGTIGDGRGSIVVDTGSGSIRVLGR